MNCWRKWNEKEKQMLQKRLMLGAFRTDEQMKAYFLIVSMLDFLNKKGNDGGIIIFDRVNGMNLFVTEWGIWINEAIQQYY